jgi:hypothetical protein
VRQTSPRSASGFVVNHVSYRRASATRASGDRAESASTSTR